MSLDSVEKTGTFYIQRIWYHTDIALTKMNKNNQFLISNSWILALKEEFKKLF